MPTTVQIERPPGAGRAWMIALVVMAAFVGGGLYLTRAKPKPQYNPNDLKQPPGAGDWADKEAAPAPAPVTARPRPQPTSAPHLVRINPAQPIYRQPAHGCPACDARSRLLAQADGSAMTVSIPAGNTLEIGPQDNNKPISVSAKPAPPHTIVAWSYLYAVLETGVSSDHPGDVIARLSQDVRDTVTQSEVLIPIGSKLHGIERGSSQVGLNDTSIIITWDDVTLPNGAHIPLPNMPAADTEGYPGLSDMVDRHLAATWGPAVAISAITAGVMLAQHPTFGGYQGYDSTQQASGAFAGSLGNRATQQLNTELMLNRPTIIIRPGTTFRVLLTRDLVFEGAYQG